MGHHASVGDIRLKDHVWRSVGRALRQLPCGLGCQTVGVRRPNNPMQGVGKPAIGLPVQQGTVQVVKPLVIGAAGEARAILICNTSSSHNTRVPAC
jgi:hypothetical protein